MSGRRSASDPVVAGDHGCRRPRARRRADGLDGGGRSFGRSRRVVRVELDVDAAVARRRFGRLQLSRCRQSTSVSPPMPRARRRAPSSFARLASSRPSAASAMRAGADRRLAVQRRRHLDDAQRDAGGQPAASRRARRAAPARRASCHPRRRAPRPGRASVRASRRTPGTSCRRRARSPPPSPPRPLRTCSVSSGATARLRDSPRSPRRRRRRAREPARHRAVAGARRARAARARRSDVRCRAQPAPRLALGCRASSAGPSRRLSTSQLRIAQAAATPKSAPANGDRRAEPARRPLPGDGHRHQDLADEPDDQRRVGGRLERDASRAEQQVTHVDPSIQPWRTSSAAISRGDRSGAADQRPSVGACERVYAGAKASRRRAGSRRRAARPRPASRCGPSASSSSVLSSHCSTPAEKSQ